METQSKSKSLKDELKQSADKYQKQLEEEVFHSVNELKRIGNVSLLLGGALLVGYTLTKYLRKDEDKSETISEEKSIGKTLLDTLVATGTEIAAVYILNFAKKKLGDYINDLKKLEKNSHGTSSGTNT